MAVARALLTLVAMSGLLLACSPATEQPAAPLVANHGRERRPGARTPARRAGLR